MSFLNPAGLLFLLAIPAVVLLHLLKIRRRRVQVSSTLLWADSLRDQQASAPFRRLKPNLLLLLQILILLLLALALARPSRTTLVSGYERTVFVLDISASMFDAAGAKIETDVAGLQRRALCLSRAAQLGAHPCQELLKGERFRDIVVCPAVQTIDLLLGCASGGQHDDGEARLLCTNRIQDVQPVLARQHHVEQHEPVVGADRLQLGPFPVVDDGH